MSPHLACLVHLDLFEDAAATGKQLGCSTTVWVDDVTISGPAHRRDLVNMVQRRAKKKGLEVHKLRRGGGQHGIELTGAYIRNNRVSVANSSHIRIRDLTTRLKAETDLRVRHTLLVRLAAMARHQRTVLHKSGESTARIDGRLVAYRREMRLLNAALSVTKPTISQAVSDPNAPVF